MNKNKIEFYGVIYMQNRKLMAILSNEDIPAKTRIYQAFNVAKSMDYLFLAESFDEARKFGEKIMRENKVKRVKVKK